mmetsp:Transcript_75501/g.200693  ORF Transcript_75501/g.200693 Transcript_75501/m.200693 type:complete len:338 (+) Transcript_75501:91-1104(+)
MGCCQSVEKEVAVETSTITPVVEDVCQTLEDTLVDKFCSRYLLKFARQELSSVNLVFLLALDELLQRLNPTGGPVQRLFAGRLRRSSTSGRLRALASGKLGEGSAEGCTGKDDDVRLLQHHEVEPPGSAELESLREIIAAHLGPKALIALPPKVANGLTEWAKNEAATELPWDHLSAAYDTTLRTVGTPSPRPISDGFAGLVGPCLPASCGGTRRACDASAQRGPPPVLPDCAAIGTSILRALPRRRPPCRCVSTSSRDSRRPTCTPSCWHCTRAKRSDVLWCGKRSRRRPWAPCSAWHSRCAPMPPILQTAPMGRSAWHSALRSARRMARNLASSA